MGYDKNNRDPDIEKLLDSLDEETSSVYRYMRDQYDSLTNEGENYNPEVDEEKVAKLASEKFGIDAEKAGKIYVDIEFQIAEKIYKKR